MASFDLYQTVTDRIVTLLESGVNPWRNPIRGGNQGMPRNLNSGNAYRGINVFLLAITAWERGYRCPWWLTFKQARDRGGTVKKGEKSTLVIFWKTYDTQDRKTGEDIKVPVLRYYRVFNAEQCEGIDLGEYEPVEPIAFTPMESCEQIVRGYVQTGDGPKVIHKGFQASYSPILDRVRMPEPGWFTGAEAYHHTLFHELIHSTGHSTRLNRGLDRELRPFGSPDYSKEELIAEMGAAFLSAEAGIEPQVVENAASYLQGWVNALKGDKKLVVTAGGAAQRAADHILGRTPAPGSVPAKQASDLEMIAQVNTGKQAA
jgi:antirestriction protein ArdC